MCQLIKFAEVWRAASDLASLGKSGQKIHGKSAVGIGGIDFEALSGVWFHDGPADRK